MKECIICKKIFESNYFKQTCCSDKCRLINRKRVGKLYRNTNKYKKQRKIYEQSDNRKKYKIDYEQSDKCQAYRLKYEATERRKQLKKEYAKTEKRKAYLKWHEHTPQRRAYLKLWRKTPAGSRRRSDKNNIKEAFTIEEWKQKVEACKGICPCCYCMFDGWLHLLTKDHIYAISKASNDFLKTGIKRIYTINDVQPLCKSCNSIKKEKDISIEELRKLVMKHNHDSKLNMLEVA